MKRQGPLSRSKPAKGSQRSNEQKKRQAARAKALNEQARQDILSGKRKVRSNEARTRIKNRKTGGLAPLRMYGQMD